MKVTKFKTVQRGCLQGVFSVLIKTDFGMLFINELKLFMKNGSRWVSFPDRVYEKDGETKYFPYAGFLNKESFDIFQEQAVKAIDEFCAKNAPDSIQSHNNVYVENSTNEVQNANQTNGRCQESDFRNNSQTSIREELPF